MTAHSAPTVWIDRDDAGRKRPELLGELQRDPATRVVLVDGIRSLVNPDGSLATPALSELPDAVRSLITGDGLADLDGHGDVVRSVYLGRETGGGSEVPVGTAYLAVAVDGRVLAALGDTVVVEGGTSSTSWASEWRDLRLGGAAMSAHNRSLLTQATAILNWHASHPFSPRTGEPTDVTTSGWVRRDASTGTEIFPRTDPVVIVGVLDDDDRILLGSNAMWELNRFSLLAGFVEPGETLEEAVVREISEEAGVTVSSIEYFQSQSWPYPASLMTGFFARVSADQVGLERPDGEEILSLRWFSRDELLAELDTVLLPGKVAIARIMIEHWLGQEITEVP